MWRYLILVLSFLTLLATVGLSPGSANAFEGRFLAGEDIILYGMNLKAEPARQTVPKNIATIVSTYLQVPTFPSGTIPPLPADATLRATLRGPGLEKPLDLEVQANSPFNIPPLVTPGTYSLDNIRLVTGGEVLLRGTPESVTIEVIEKLLVTQVTARPLTAAEIREKGIVYDKTNFQAYNFTAAFAVEPGKEIKLDMPVLLPALATTQNVSVPAVGMDSLPGAQLKSVSTIIPDSLKLAQTRIPNLSVTGFSLKMDKYVGNTFVVPPIPGVVVIPGDIGFLNQYFSVMLMVGNVAPAGSNLVVKDLKAEIFLPPGKDSVAGSSDDPLRMAMTDTGESPRIKAVTQPGPDGKLGTADDIISLAPGESGNAEYLVEGRREGSHTVEMEITGTLYGLPIGPVTVRGRAAGTVLVRNPTFTMTFTHPDVVTAGEEYTLDVTVTNTSASPANFVSINLHQGQIGGADLVDPAQASQQIETIPPGDSASVSFDLRSKVSGKVFAATLDSDEQIAGRFQLKTSVGELGIPLSPDSLVLPKESRYLPKSLRDAALGLLGKAYAVATAPAAALPKDIRRFGKKIVWTRGIEVAQAGFRHTMGVIASLSEPPAGEPLADTAAQLLYDFMGSGYARLPEQFAKPDELKFEQDDFTGFDELRRRSVRGDVLAGTVASILSPDFVGNGGAEFQRALSSKTAYRPSQISVVVDGRGAEPPVSLSLVDPSGRVLGGVDAKGKVLKEIPFSEFMVMKEAGQPRGLMAVVALPTPGSHTIRLTRAANAADTPFTLSVVAPDDKGVLQQRVFSGITATDLPVITLPDGSPVSFTLQLAGPGAMPGAAPVQPTSSPSIPDPPPSVISVVQQADADKVENDCGMWRFGRVVAALFTEEVTPQSVQDRVARALITNYAMDDNQVVGVAMQPGNRIAFIALRDPVGPFVDPPPVRRITFTGVADRLGQTVNGQSVPIRATIADPAAVVSGTILNPDGTPLEGAEVRLFHQIEVMTDDGCMPSWYGVSTKFTKAGATYGWDYVLKGTNKITALNTADNDYRELLFTPARNGQRLNVDVVMLGRGILRGKILGEDGATPLANASIRVTSMTDASQYGFTTGPTGEFTIPRIPVGNFLVEAVHLSTNSKVVQSGYMAQSGGVVEMNLVLFTEQIRKITIKYAALKGHVLNYDGATPANGLPVFAWYQDNSQDGVRCPVSGDSIPPECAVASATTDSMGAYSFPDIPAGGYRVYSFNQATYQEGSARTVVAPDSTATVNILLNGGFATIKGVVLDAAGKPVANAEVGGGMSLAVTGADGSFTLTDVPLGRRTLVAVSRAFFAKGQATLDLAVPGAEYPATIVLEAQGGIFGTVRTAAGATVEAGIDVYLITGCESGYCVIGTAKTNADGSYRIDNVPVSGSEYKLSAFRADLSDGNVVPVRVLFSGQRVRGDLTFKGGGGTVTGGIWNANGNTPLAGKVSISALRVLSASYGEKKIGLGFEHTQHLQIVDTTIENNRFTFSNVLVGPFVITAAGSFSPEPVTFSGEITESGQTKVVDIRLSPTSIVTGVVYGPDGATPAKNAVVTFKSDEFRTICTDTDPMSAVSQSGNTVTINLDALSGEQSCKAIPQGIQALDTRTDDQGRFTFPLVNAGKFTINVEEHDASDNPTGRTGSITSTVAPGKTTELSFRLNSRAPVRVTVLTSGGGPVANATVKVEQSSRIGDTTRPVYRTDASGVVMLNGADALDEGVFTVLAESNDGFTSGGRVSGKVIADGVIVDVKLYLFDHTVTVKGVVYRQDGITPVKNAEVAIANGSGDLAFAVTNASGEYSQDYIPLGDFRVSVFEAATGRRGFATGTAYLTTPIVTVNVSEMPIGLVKGTVYQGGDLQPLARWIVTLRQSYPSGRSLTLQATTGLDGKFSFPGVAAGPFSITAWREGQTSITANGNLTREGEIIDIPMLANLAKPQLGSITGWVYLSDGSPGANTAICLGYYCSNRTTADADGKFTIDNLPIDRFTVYAQNQVNSERGVGYATVPYAGGTGFVKVVMEGLGTVSGTVLNNGSPVSGSRVILTKDPDAGCGAASCDAFTGANGSFRFENVPAGPFSLVAVDSVNPQQKGSAGGVLNPKGIADVTIAYAITAAVRFKVVNAKAAAVPGVVVEMKRTADQFVLYRETDPSGVVTFDAVPFGSYDLLFQDPASQGLARLSRQIVGDTDLTSTPVILDEAPPVVKASSPLPGEIRVPLDRVITVTFSEPVQPGTVDSSTVVLSSIDGPVTGTVSLDAGGTVATFRLQNNQPLKDERQYTISVRGVQDLIGRTMVQNFTATFTTVDITPPAIVSLSPSPAAATGFPLDGVVRVLYGEPFDPTGFTGQAITMTGPAGPLDGRVDAILGNTGLVFTPKYPLQPDTSYTVSIRPAVDLSGNARPGGESFVVTTSDRTPPKVTGLSLYGNGVPLTTVIENGTVDVIPYFGGSSDVAMVDWYLNGLPVQVTRTAPYRFSFTASPTYGKPGDTIAITAYATDTSGNRGLVADSYTARVLVTSDQLPTVSTSVISPTPGGTEFGNCVRVSVLVSASDDVGIARIGYRAIGGVGLDDCQPQPLIPPATRAYTLPVPQRSATGEFSFYVPRSAAPGSKITVYAVAVDTKGQQTTADPVVISVLDRINPVVSFAGLSSGDAVKPGQKITAVVAATDAGGISRLVFSVNGTVVDDRTVPVMTSVGSTFFWTVPMSFTTRDQVRLNVTAYDASGNSADAPGVVLPVADTTPPVVVLRTSTGSLDMNPGQPVTVVVTVQDDTILSSLSVAGSGAFNFSDGAVFPTIGYAEKSFIVNVPPGTANGAQLTVSATATDASGNTSAPVTMILTARSLAAVQLPQSQLMAAGDSVALSATLSQPAAAGGVSVNLATSSGVQVQPSLLAFAEGESTKQFTLTGVAGGLNTVSAQISGATVTTMNVTVRGGIVSGTAVTIAGQPVSGAQVVINGTTVTTAADGTFFAEGIAGPAVSISAYDSVNRLQGYLKGNMNQANGYLRGASVVLSEAGAINGVVKNADGTAAAAGAQVSLYAERDTAIALDTVFTAADGTFSFPQVQLGTYVLIAADTAANRGRSTVYLTVSGATVPATVTYLGKGTINGLVRDASGAGVGGLTVKLTSSHLFGSDSSTGVSGSDGRFAFTGVTVGNFSLSATDSVSGYGATTTGTISTNGQVVNATLTLSAYGTVEGHVYRSNGSAPAVGVTVRASGLTTTTDQQGYYRFEILPLGYLNVSADDPSARSKGQAAARLQSHKETVTADITLGGNANLSVTVRDSSLNAVAGARVYLSDGYGSISGTTDASGIVVLSHVSAGSFTISAVKDTLHGTLTGTVGDGSTLDIFVDVAADPSATVTGRVLMPDGLSPAAGVTVTLASIDCRNGWYCTSNSLKTDGDGGFTFAAQKLNTYDLSVRDANYQLRAKSLDIRLVTNGETVDRTLTMVGLGTVTGRITIPNGTGAPNMPVTVQGRNPDFGTTTTVRTNAGGYYQVERVPLGPVSVTSGDVSQMLLGETSGTLASDGSTLTLDISLLSNAVTMPQTLYDGNMQQFDIQGAGTLRSGQNGIFYSSNAADLGGASFAIVSNGTTIPFPSLTAGTKEMMGRQLVLQPGAPFTFDGLNVTRKVYVPQEGYFARYLEVIDNPTADVKTFTAKLRTSFRNDYYSPCYWYTCWQQYYNFSLTGTSSGDTTLQAGAAGDTWAVIDNTSNSYYGSPIQTRFAPVWGGQGAAVPASALSLSSWSNVNSTFFAPAMNTDWSLTLQPGERVALMHFLVQEPTAASAKEAAQRLAQLPPEALAGLGQDDLTAIRNFIVPLDGSSTLTAMPPLTGTVQVNLLDGTGAPATEQLSITLQSTNPIFDKIYSASNQVCVWDWWYGSICTISSQASFASNLYTSSPSIGIPRGPFTVTATRALNSGNLVQTATGDFSPGSGTAVVNLRFVNSGNLNGTLRHANGNLVTNSSLTLLNATGSQIATASSSNGSYTMNLLPTGSVTVKLCVPWSVNQNQTASCTTAPAVVTAGQTTVADITMPALGTIRGQVLLWDGNPATGTLYFTGTGSMAGFQRYVTLDSAGNYLFSEVPPGTYEIEAHDPANYNNMRRVAVTMSDGREIVQDIRFSKSGYITLTATYADGTTIPNYSYGTITVLEQPGDVAVYSYSYMYPSGNSTSFFASDAANFKVRYSFYYNQPNYTSGTSTGETVIAGFTTSGASLPVTIQLPLYRANLAMTPLGSDGQPMRGANILMQVVDPTDSTKVWGTCYTYSSGTCTVNGIWASTAGVRVQALLNGSVVAETAAAVTGSTTINVNLQLPFDPVVFSKTLYDGNGGNFDITASGGVQYGINSVFYQYYSTPGAMTLRVGSASYNGPSNNIGVAEEKGRELVSKQDSVSGLNVTRKVYVPTDGYFARYLDIFTNPGTTDVTIDLGTDTRFYYYQYWNSSYYDFAVRAASDPAIADTTSVDRDLAGTTWAVVDVSTSTTGMPAVAMVYADGTARTPTNASFSTIRGYWDPSRASFTFGSVTVPAGRSVALMNFLVQQTTREAAVASAKRLIQLPPEALSGLSPEERAMVVNFTLPADGVGTVAPLPALDGTVTGTVRDYVGQVPTTPNSGTTVTLKSSLPYYPKSVSIGADSTTGAFSIATNNYEGSYRTLIPRAPFTLSATASSYSFTLNSAPVSGDFASGSATAQQDIVFSAASTILATLTRYDGTPATGARVYASNVQGYGHNFADIGNGLYRRTFFPAGDYIINAELQAPSPSSGTAVTVSGQIAAVSGQENSIALSFPQLATIGGTVKNYNGLPVSGNYVVIRSTTKEFSRSLNTYNGSNGGAAGTFAFRDLPPDTYTVMVRDNSYGFDYSSTVTVAAGETVSRDFTYTTYGAVTGKVSFRTALPGYYPTYVNLDVRETVTGRVVATASSSCCSDDFSTSLFAAAAPGTQYELRAWYTYVYNAKTAEVVVPLANFTTPNQVLNLGTIALPLERGDVTVAIVDTNNAPLTDYVSVQLMESDGTILASAGFNGSYTFTGVYTGQTSLTARATYSGRSFDVPVTIVPNGTATAQVIVSLATLNGAVYAGDGATLLTGGFEYWLTNVDGTVTYPCGSTVGSYYWTYVSGYGYLYRYYFNDTTVCSSYDGNWSLTGYTYLNPTDSWWSFVPTLRKIPVRAGENLMLHVRSLSGLGECSYPFTYDGTPTVNATLPIFVAKGSVMRPDGTPVVDTSVTMVVSDPADPTVNSTYGAWSDGNGAFTLLGTRTGTFQLGAQTPLGAVASYPGGGTIASYFTPLTGLDMTLEPTGTISGNVTRGGVPLYNATVTITLPDRVVSQNIWTDPSGQFTAQDVPFTAYVVSAQAYDPSTDGTAYSNSVSGALTAEAPVATVTLLFDLPPGTLFGTVRDPAGDSVRWETVTVTRVSTGESMYPSTDNSGYYQLSGLAPDGYLVEYSGWGYGEGPRITGSAYGILTDGGTLNLDLNLRDEVNLAYGMTTELVAATDGFRYGIGADGVLMYGGNNSGLLTSPFVTSHTLEFDVGGLRSVYGAGRGWYDQYGQLVLKPSVMQGLLLSRKIYLPPQGGYLRYLEQFANPLATPVTVQPNVYGQLTTPASGNWSFFVDPAVTGTGYAIDQAAGDNAMPQLGMVLQGNSGTGTLVPVGPEWATADYPDWYWSTDVPSSGTACILHFVFQGDPSDANMEAKAQALRDLDAAALNALGLPSDPLYGLTAAERACIRNFNVPVAP